MFKTNEIKSSGRHKMKETNFNIFFFSKTAYVATKLALVVCKQMRSLRYIFSHLETSEKKKLLKRWNSWYTYVHKALLLLVFALQLFNLSCLISFFICLAVRKENTTQHSSAVCFIKGYLRFLFFPLSTSCCDSISFHLLLLLAWMFSVLCCLLAVIYLLFLDVV